MKRILGVDQTDSAPYGDSENRGENVDRRAVNYYDCGMKEMPTPADASLRRPGCYY